MQIEHIITINNKAYILQETAYVITTEDEHYTDVEILEHNAELDIWDSDTIKEGTENEHYTQEEIDDHNEELDIWDIDTIKKEAMIDTDEITIIYVPIDSANDYKELNPDLNIVGYNYNSYQVSEPEYYEQAKIICSIESNPKLMEVLYSYHYCANPKYMTLAEAKAITSIEPILDSENGNQVETFNEFQYFTNVTEIPENFARGNTYLREITLPKSITAIWHMAFGIPSAMHNAGGISKLVKVDGLDNVSTVGRNAFQFAENLTTLNFTNKLTTLDTGVFVYCKNLKSIGDTSNITSVMSSCFLFSGIRIFVAPKFNSITSTSTWIFSSGNDTDDLPLNTLILDWNNITILPDYFCKRCSIEKIPDMPKVTQIGRGCFAKCQNLKEIGYMPNCTRIVKFAFDSCPKLDLNYRSTSPFPNLTVIEKCAFQNYKGGRAYFPKVNNVGLGAFENAENTTIEFGLPFSSITFHTDAFKNATNITVICNGVEFTEAQYTTYKITK